MHGSRQHPARPLGTLPQQGNGSLRQSETAPACTVPSRLLYVLAADVVSRITSLPHLVYGFLDPTHCAHGYRLATTPWCSDDPHRCRCCGHPPRTDCCGCTDPAECVHCGRALAAGRWVSGDYGPACFRCLAARGEEAGGA